MNTTSKMVRLTSAQILTLTSSPVKVIAEPGLNKMIRIISSVCYYKFGTLPYKGVSGGPTLYYGTPSFATVAIGDYFQGFGFTRSQVQTVKQQNDNEDPSIFFNQPITLCDEAGNYTAGDGTAKIWICFSIVDFN